MGGVATGSFKALSGNLDALVLSAHLGQGGIPGEKRRKCGARAPYTPRPSEGRESAVEVTALGAARPREVRNEPLAET